jgi:hypothetical protein
MEYPCPTPLIYNPLALLLLLAVGVPSLQLISRESGLYVDTFPLPINV